MDSSPPLFPAGQRLGRYQLLRRLAVGGMAEVYLAFAAGPGDFRKVVAIKRLLPQHALDPQLLRMFLDEARLMAGLSHPHVPQVTDVDDAAAGDVPYFVMEYVHGTDLRGVLNAAAGPLPWEQALEIATGVAAGLHHAHEHRGAAGQPLEIVHRDVSPSNVLISFDGGVKITDFGVAKWTEQKSFTHHGQLKGKFAHMSPEQCRGESLDRRSDVFALGTLLYEMTTGHPPFVAESEYDLLTQIVSKDAPPPRRPGEIFPPQLEAILMKSLRRQREERQPTAQQLQLELEAFARERRLVTSPVALARYVESLFGAQVTEWRQAAASGRSLADHLGKAEAPPAAPAFPAIAGGGPSGGPRTATDAFAVPGPRAGVPAGAAPAISAGRRRSRLGGVGIRRTVVVGAAAAAALTLLMTATELTSRWQRGARPNIPVAPLRGHDEMVVPSAGRFEPARPAVQAAAAPVHPAAPREANHAPQATPAAVPPARRGREAAGHGTRPASGVAVTARGTSAPPATIIATGAMPSEPAIAPRASDGQSGHSDSAAAGALSPAQVPPRAPVKVWDPDSPLPP